MKNREHVKMKKMSTHLTISRQEIIIMFFVVLNHEHFSIIISSSFFLVFWEIYSEFFFFFDTVILFWKKLFSGHRLGSTINPIIIASTCINIWRWNSTKILNYIFKELNHIFYHHHFFTSRTHQRWLSHSRVEGGFCWVKQST